MSVAAGYCLNIEGAGLPKVAPDENPESTYAAATARMD